MVTESLDRDGPTVSPSLSGCLVTNQRASKAVVVV